MNKFNHTKHMELWNWLAENPGCFKSEWPGFNCEDNMPDHRCYACDATDTGCHGCPIDWGNGLGCCSSKMFEKWHVNVTELKMKLRKENEEDVIRKIREAAIAIADAPLRTDVEYEIV